MEKQDAFTQALLRAMDAAEQEAGVRRFGKIQRLLYGR